jgi:hypothetical protein
VPLREAAFPPESLGDSPQDRSSDIVSCFRNSFKIVAAIGTFAARHVAVRRMAGTARIRWTGTPPLNHYIAAPAPVAQLMEQRVSKGKATP